MISSMYVSGVIYDTLSGLSAVTTAVGDRIYRRWYLDDEAEYVAPFIVYRHIEPTVDDGTLGGPVASQTHRFEVAIYDDGRQFSNVVIAAIEAFDTAIQTISVTVAGKGWHITCRQEQELPDLDLDYGLPYVRAGCIYAFDVG